MRHTMMTSKALLLFLLVCSISGENNTALVNASESSATFIMCGIYSCGKGEDCLRLNGYKKCADPCGHYAVLDDPRRSVSNKLSSDASSLDDRKLKWDGWYRLMLNGVNARIPEICVEETMCGAETPLWLSSTHPRPEAGVVRSRVCGMGKGSCCRYNSNQILVKSCPGGFYIYKLEMPSRNNMAYCAAVSELPTTTTPVPTTTTTTTPEPTTTPTPEPRTTTNAAPKPGTTTSTTIEPRTTTTTIPEPTTNTTTTPEPTTTTTTAPEPTAATATITTTPEPTTTTNTAPETTITTTPEPTTTAPPISNTTTKSTKTTTNPPVPDTTSPPITEPVLVCGRDVLEIGLPHAQMTAFGLDASSAHLSEPRCSAHQERNGTVWYQVERKAGGCGNTLTTNKTHAVFSNTIFVYPLTIASGALPQPIRIRFSCVYPMASETSLDVAIKPYMGKTRIGLVNMGSEAQASMSLFRNANYSEPYPAGPVSLPLGSTLHVGVSVEETETEHFVVVLEDCYITPSTNADNLQRYFLIQHQCPADRRQVTVDESGLSLQARFSALLFLYQGDYRDVYLHCSISLCDQRTSSCSPLCSRRAQRSSSTSLPLKPLTIGPITLDQNAE